jgi:GNAT superfamily N-acetyltransferase
MDPVCAEVLREARASDAAALARLRWEFRAGLEPAREGEAAFLRRCQAWMESRLAPGSAWRCWVIEERGEILGQAWVQILEKVPNPNPTAEPEQHACISNVYVRAASRGRGRGARLMACCLEWCRARDVDSVILWPSDQSRSLYERLGFRDSGRLWEATRP